MRKYTIGGTTYIATDDRLFTRREESHNFDEINDTDVYLYDDEVVKLYSKFSTIEIMLLSNTDHTRVEHESEFTDAVPLDSIRPDGIRGCPTDGCDGWAGPVDEPESQYCFECGYGVDS